MNAHYPFVAERAGHRCEYCHAPEAIFNVPFEVDHIFPIARGGLDEAANWALACRACNLRKSATVDGIDPLTSQRVSLFHPREQVWSDHFGIEGEPPLLLVGKTPVGRVTIERLQLNTVLQQTARAPWIALDLFP